MSENINYSAHQNMFNPFTEQIVKGTKKIVRIRNGMIVRPIWQEPVDEHDNGCFQAKDWKFIWNRDGTSITSRDYDMIEFITSLDDV
jgi:hypothetical protein